MPSDILAIDISAFSGFTTGSGPVTWDGTKWRMAWTSADDEANRTKTIYRAGWTLAQLGFDWTGDKQVQSWSFNWNVTPATNVYETLTRSAQLQAVHQETGWGSANVDNAYVSNYAPDPYNWNETFWFPHGGWDYLSYHGVYLTSANAATFTVSLNYIPQYWYFTDPSLYCRLDVTGCMMTVTYDYLVPPPSGGARTRVWAD